MVGRADKGLFITTGTFTPAAVKEATRDGAPPIDLVDGLMLADKLKDFGLGIKREQVERVIVDELWFQNLWADRSNPINARLQPRGGFDPVARDLLDVLCGLFRSARRSQIDHDKLVDTGVAITLEVVLRDLLGVGRDGSSISDRLWVDGGLTAQ
jgi:Restriction endonuclease